MDTWEKLGRLTVNEFVYAGPAWTTNVMILSLRKQ